jgi:hypothetical protein
MDRIEYKNDIVVFNNFINIEECNAILKYWEHATIEGKMQWGSGAFNYEFGSTIIYNDTEIIKFNLPMNYFSDLERKIVEATELVSGSKIKKIGMYPQKWLTGSYASFHYDNSGKDSSVQWATGLYLNEDYEGGELQFQNELIEIKPRTGMLAIFHGGNNLHGVKTVTSGTRYKINCFWGAKE